MKSYEWITSHPTIINITKMLPLLKVYKNCTFLYVVRVSFLLHCYLPEVLVHCWNQMGCQPFFFLLSLHFFQRIHHKPCLPQRYVSLHSSTVPCWKTLQSDLSLQHHPLQERKQQSELCIDFIMDTVDMRKNIYFYDRFYSSCMNLLDNFNTAFLKDLSTLLWKHQPPFG